jgi:predicted transcriptional regulator
MRAGNIRDARGRIPLTAAEIAHFLGVTPSAVRHIVRRQEIAAAGKIGKAKTYWLHEVTKAAGSHERRAG